MLLAGYLQIGALPTVMLMVLNQAFVNLSFSYADKEARSSY